MIALKNNKAVTVFHGIANKLSVFLGKDNVYPVGGTPYKLTFNSITGWTKRVTQSSFQDNGPKIYFQAGTIRVEGVGTSSAFAQGGYYMPINTGGCPYVDLEIGSWFTSSPFAYISLDGKPIYYKGQSSVNIPIDPNKPIQELYIAINSGGDGYNAHYASIKSLYFHN